MVSLFAMPYCIRSSPGLTPCQGCITYEPTVEHRSLAVTPIGAVKLLGALDLAAAPHV